MPINATSQRLQSRRRHRCSRGLSAMVHRYIDSSFAPAKHPKSYLELSLLENNLCDHTFPGYNELDGSKSKGSQKCSLRMAARARARARACTPNVIAPARFTFETKRGRTKRAGDDAAHHVPPPPPPPPHFREQICNPPSAQERACIYLSAARAASMQEGV